jgi:hypothetical protein
MGPGSYSVKMALNNVASAEVNMAIGRLVDAHVDYLADAAVLNATSAVQFQGLVESVEINGDQATISLRNGQEMTDVRMGGLGVVGVDVRELVWSLARSAGITEDKIAIPGWVPGPDELFEVVIPLSGLQVDRRFDIGDVLITTEPHVKQSVDISAPTRSGPRFKAVRAGRSRMFARGPCLKPKPKASKPSLWPSAG